MPFRQTITTLVGAELYASLEAEAEKEVALALQMPLRDEYRQEKYYRCRPFRGGLLKASEAFEMAGLKISPLDVTNILFRCKMLFAAENETEYRQRIGGGSYPDEIEFIHKWAERDESIDVVTDRYFDRLESRLSDRILLSEINSFHDSPGQQAFFDDLFSELNLPFECFLDEARLIERHREMEPGLSTYQAADSKDFFCAPSIGFRAHGSELYCRLYAMAHLRTFLNLLRTASFVIAPQRDRGWRDVQLMAPTAPVMRGQPPFRTMEVGGCFCWEEDEKESWGKVPDGSLFLSFGYRGLSKMWLDGRSFAGMKNFIIENRAVLDQLKNPWNPKVLNDLAPTIDILSSATQIPDFGAKILLLYCCLEHLFVPKEIKSDNKKYIVGGLHALSPKLKPWFDELYNLRNNYAHKGFVLSNEKTMGLVILSVQNIMSLLVAKLKAT